jgi:hypothetical protein
MERDAGGSAKGEAMDAHHHDWQPGPVNPDSTALILGCADCGIPKPIRSRVVNGCLICLDCKAPLVGWRTDFTGRWHGVHICRP